MAYTFRGGLTVEEYKNTRKSRIETLPPPEKVYIPLTQYRGRPAQPCVHIGDAVTMGQCIGTVPEDVIGCPVHASVSGVVTDLIRTSAPEGDVVEQIVIRNDRKYTPCPTVTPCTKKLTEVTAEEIIRIVREAGIAGLGGAGFPTYEKIRAGLGKVEKLIINGTESEPFLTADHRLMLEHPASIINGVKILLKALGVRTAYIAVENNKMDAVGRLDELLNGSRMISVKPVKTRYPQGDERQLIYALTGTEIPDGKHPADVGCLVFNVETCAAIYKAFASGLPLLTRVITVDGDCVRKPKNLLVPIGTPVSDLLAFCGGLIREPERLLDGGPMMGQAMENPDPPVTKTTGAVLFLSAAMNRKKGRETCIRCGKCVECCPMHLMPLYLAQFAQRENWKQAQAYGAMSCVECGACAYTCPGGVELVRHIRAAKEAIRAEQEMPAQEQ